jgi:hypothetical protein
MAIPTQKRMREWINVPSFLETSLAQPVEGKMLYGIRRPIRSSTTPLIECEIGTRERIEGQKPGYWFVSENQDVKVRLPIIYSVNDNNVKAIGYDTGRLFLAIVKRKN